MNRVSLGAAVSTILHLAKLYTPSADGPRVELYVPWKATQTCGYQGAHAFGIDRALRSKHAEKPCQFTFGGRINAERVHSTERRVSPRFGLVYIPSFPDPTLSQSTESPRR
jgi:hypothetical protein